MKVLHLSKLYPPFMGGIETVVYDLVEESKKFASQVDVLCVSENNSSKVDKSENIVIFRCSSFLHLFSTYLSFSYVLQWIKIRNNYDIVHVHVPNPLAALCLFLFPTKSKIIVHWHSDIIKQRILKKILAPIHDSLLNKCASVVATSKSYADASPELVVLKDKLKVIPIGISSDRLSFSIGKVEEIKLKYGNNIILSVGRHVYYKGFEYLINSARFLPDGYTILIGGHGELTDSLKAQVVEFGLEKKVKFLGRIPDSDLANYYKSAAVFCLPSIERSEAFGVVQLEAMALGTPIVSTDIPGSGVSWVNKEKVSGHVVAPRDSKALANAFIDICENSALDETLIKKRFNDLFTREVMANEFRKLYD